MSIATQITRLNNNIEAIKNTKQQIKDAVNNDFDIIANEQIENYDTLIENGLELYKQYIPPVETNQATEIQVTDAMKCNSNKLELFGNTEQASYSGKNLIPTQVNLWEQGAITSATGEDSSSTTRLRTKEYYPISNDTDYRVSIQDSNYCFLNIILYDNNKEYVGQYYSISPQINGTRNKLINIPSGTMPNVAYYRAVVRNTDNNATIIANEIEIAKPQIELGSTATDYEPYTGGQPSPNPDYPQDIHVVTGNNTIGVTGKNILNWNLFEGNNYVNVINKTQKILSLTGITKYYSGACILLNLKPNTQYTIKAIVTIIGTNSRGVIGIFNKNYNGAGELSSSNRIALSNNVTAPGEVLCTFTTDETGIVYILFQCNHNTNNGSITYENIQLEEGAIATSFEPYIHRDYSLNLGSLELCKIGNYQDYIYKENGNWYKYGIIYKKVLKGTEMWEKRFGTNLFDIQGFFNSKKFVVGYGLSNYYKYNSVQSGLNVNLSNGEFALQEFSSTYNVFIKNTNYNNINDFKTWLSTHNTSVYFPLVTPTTTQITDETLITQLEAIYNHLALVKGVNHITVTASDLAPYMKLSYKNYELTSNE